MKRIVLLLFTLLSMAMLLAQCQRNLQFEAETEKVFINHHDTVQYVGIATCAGCHNSIYESFIQTGMGQSFAPANREKSALPRRPAMLLDSASGLAYWVRFIDDSLFVKEFLLGADGDTLHQLLQKVDYIIGSGQHTNSHISSEQGYLHQMPFTFYTQRGLIDLPPGFENGFNSRFSRLIGLECMSCHNAMPTGFVLGSENKFVEVPHGIDCERCHGPGQAHVHKMLRGDITDTSMTYDPSIVNPKKLSAELQFEICQRCHLQGNAVLQAGKSFFDFKPGMVLNEVMDIYMPRTSSDHEQFIMAGHIQRFKMSKCFIENNKQFVCTSCHDPHVSVQQTDPQRFQRVCIDCHGDHSKSNCTASIASRNAVNDQCTQCHMPLEGSVDIPHVRVHDHYIRIPTNTPAAEPKVENGLYAVNNPRPTRLSRLKAYLQQFERFDNQAVLLDSAKSLLEGEGEEYFMARVHYFFLREAYDSIVALDLRSQPGSRNKAQMEWDNRFAWTSYRLAIAWKMTSTASSQADEYFQQAIAASPYVLDFRVAYAAFLLESGKVEEAMIHYKWCVDEYPVHAEALNGIGYCWLLQDEATKALPYFNRCLAQEPNHVLARINRILVYLQQNDEPSADRDMAYLEQFHNAHPKVEALKAYWQNL